MTDVAVETTGPTTEVAPETTAPTTTAPAKPESVEKQLAGIANRSWKPSVAAKINTPRDEAGRFTAREGLNEGATAEVAPAGSEGATAEVPSTEGQAPAATSGVATDQPAAAGPPEGFVRVPLAPDHFLRKETGKEYLDVPAEAERYTRWVVNQGPRVADYQSAMRRAQTAEARAEEHRAIAEFWQRETATFFGPEYLQRHQEIERAWGPEQAEIYRQGQLQKAWEKLGQTIKATRQQQAQSRLISDGQKFRQLALANAREKYPLFAPGQLQEALEQYGAWVDAKRVTELRAEDWYRIADTIYERLPAVRQAREQSRREAIRREVEEGVKKTERERLERAATARAENPLGASTPAFQTGRTTPDTTRAPDNRTAAEQLAEIAKAGRRY